jgi:hypothetical protein
VFVCRYAYALYSMRDRDITFSDAKTGPHEIPFELAITKSENFQFHRDDMVRIRRELSLLIDKLSTIYKRLKDANDEVEKIVNEMSGDLDETK